MFIHMFVHVIMNRHGHHNIRNGIVWAQTSHKKHKDSHMVCVIEL